MKRYKTSKYRKLYMREWRKAVHLTIADRRKLCKLIREHMGKCSLMEAQDFAEIEKKINRHAGQKRNINVKK